MKCSSEQLQKCATDKIKCLVSTLEKCLTHLNRWSSAFGYNPFWYRASSWDQLVPQNSCNMYSTYLVLSKLHSSSPSSIYNSRDHYIGEIFETKIIVTIQFNSVQFNSYHLHHLQGEINFWYRKMWNNCHIKHNMCHIHNTIIKTYLDTQVPEVDSNSFQFPRNEVLHSVTSEFCDFQHKIKLLWLFKAWKIL